MLCKGRVQIKKNQLWKIPYRVLIPPPGYGNFLFFSETRPFLRTFCKKCFHHWKSKKMIKLLWDKQIFASSNAITAATRKILSTTCAILALTWFCHLSMYLWSLGGGLRSSKGGPPFTWKKLQCLKMIFKPFGEKKI